MCDVYVFAGSLTPKHATARERQRATSHALGQDTQPLELTDVTGVTNYRVFVHLDIQNREGDEVPFALPMSRRMATPTLLSGGL